MISRHASWITSSVVSLTSSQDRLPVSPGQGTGTYLVGEQVYNLVQGTGVHLVGEQVPTCWENRCATWFKELVFTW